MDMTARLKAAKSVLEPGMIIELLNKKYHLPRWGMFDKLINKDVFFFYETAYIEYPKTVYMIINDRVFDFTFGMLPDGKLYHKQLTALEPLTKGRAKEICQLAQTMVNNVKTQNINPEDIGGFIYHNLKDLEMSPGGDELIVNYSGRGAA